MKQFLKHIPCILLLCCTIMHFFTGSASALEEYRLSYMYYAPLQPLPLTVTSPYGPRELNGHSFHHGIDFAADDGQEVYAVASGVVQAADDLGGDGGWIVIRHNQDWYSVYIDLDPAGTIVGVGETVSGGQVIGHVGNFGTGAHLHFEIRTMSYDVGHSLIPLAYAPYAPWLPANCVKDSFAKEFGIRWNPGADFTGPVKKAIDTVAEACSKAVEFLGSVIGYIMSLLMIIDLCITFLMTSLPNQDGSGGGGSANIFKLLAAKLLLYGFLFFTVTHFSGCFFNTIRDFFLGVGADAVGGTLESVKQAVADPFSIVTRGAKIVEPVFLCFADVEVSFGADFFKAIAMGIPALIFLIAVFGAFVMIAIQISLAYLEFYMAAVFGFTSFMFSGWNKTRTYAERGMNAIFATTIKLFFFTIFAAIMTSTVSTMTIANLVTEKEVNMDTITAHTDGNFRSVEEFAGAIKLVETSGSSDSYITPSADGYGYGAYQISYANWEYWCEDAGINDIPPQPWPYDSAAWVSPGEQSQPYSSNWRNELPAAPTPWPPSVQDKVAIYRMQQYYQQYGDWEHVAYAWNGGGGAADNPSAQVKEYWKRVCEANGTLIRKMHVLNIWPVILLTTYCLLFVFMGDRVAKNIDNLLNSGSSWIFIPNK